MKAISHKTAAIVIAGIMLQFAPHQAFGQESSVQGASGNFEYALPSTSLAFEVTATGTHFTAGPFARFSQKMLGISAASSDAVYWAISEITMTSQTEADPKARYNIQGSKTFLSETQGLLQASSLGLVSVPELDRIKSVSACYSANETNIFESFDAPYTQAMLQAATLEDKARAAAELIYTLRATRIQILTGDTDATYSGEAMNAVLSELTRLEKAYTALFTGTFTQESKTVCYTIVPDPASAQKVAFRFSDKAGLLSSEDADGEPMLVEIKPDAVQYSSSQMVSGKPGTVKYELKSRIPAFCTITLSDGITQYIQARIPVYQYGVETTYPVFAK